MGYPSRQAFYEALTVEELQEWEACYAVDPWGEERYETLHGILCNLVDACHRAKGRPEPPLTYMPFVKAIRGGGNRGGQTEEEMKAIWNQVVAQWDN